MIHHFPHFDPETGDWHAVYMVAGTKQLASIGAGLTRQAAVSMCHTANVEQQRQHRESQAAARDRSERPTPAGFYTDEDAR